MKELRYDKKNNKIIITNVDVHCFDDLIDEDDIDKSLLIKNIRQVYDEVVSLYFLHINNELTNEQIDKHVMKICKLIEDTDVIAI